MKSISSRRTNSMDFLFSMILFLVFILCSVFTILIGSRVYSNIRLRNDAAFYSDTALSYVSNKVRQSDRDGCISVREMDGQSVLILASGTEDLIYETWIYTRDGSLMELFSEAGSGLGLEAGTPVMECEAISFSLLTENSGSEPIHPLLSVRLTEDDGKIRECFLSLRSMKGGEE